MKTNIKSGVGANAVMYIALSVVLAALVLFFADAGSKIYALVGCSYVLSIVAASLYLTGKLSDRIKELTASEN